MSFTQEKKYNIIILDSPEITCPPHLLKVYIEFCGAFTRRGYSVKISNSINEITDNSIVLMGDFFHVDNPANILYNQSKNAIYIGWYWHNQDISILPYFIHLYENTLAENPLPDKVPILKLMNSITNSCPLLLRANDAVEDVGTFERNVDKDYCFMGGRIFDCDGLVPDPSFKGLYHAVCDVSQYLDYDVRRTIYLSSVFALGFQSVANIKNAHVSQRIFEGLCYGCVVFSNSIHASHQTDGIVEYITSKQELESRMKYYLENTDKIKEKQELGYKFVREKGTNNYSAQKIMDVIKQVYNIEIDF
jgi:hypothetical protein